MISSKAVAVAFVFVACHFATHKA